MAVGTQAQLVARADADAVALVASDAPFPTAGCA
jgi:hypothetical protein